MRFCSTIDGILTSLILQLSFSTVWAIPLSENRISLTTPIKHSAIPVQNDEYQTTAFISRVSDFAMDEIGSTNKIKEVQMLHNYGNLSLEESIASLLLRNPDETFQEHETAVKHPLPLLSKQTSVNITGQKVESLPKKDERGKQKPSLPMRKKKSSMTKIHSSHLRQKTALNASQPSLLGDLNGNNYGDNSKQDPKAGRLLILHYFSNDTPRNKSETNYELKPFATNESSVETQATRASGSGINEKDSRSYDQYYYYYYEINDDKNLVDNGKDNIEELSQTSEKRNHADEIYRNIFDRQDDVHKSSVENQTLKQNNRSQKGIQNNSMNMDNQNESHLNETILSKKDQLRSVVLSKYKSNVTKFEDYSTGNDLVFVQLRGHESKNEKFISTSTASEIDGTHESTSTQLVYDDTTRHTFSRSDLINDAPGDEPELEVKSNESVLLTAKKKGCMKLSYSVNETSSHIANDSNTEEETSGLVESIHTINTTMEMKRVKSVNTGRSKNVSEEYFSVKNVTPHSGYESATISHVPYISEKITSSMTMGPTLSLGIITINTPIFSTKVDEFQKTGDVTYKNSTQSKDFVKNNLTELSTLHMQSYQNISGATNGNKEPSVDSRKQLSNLVDSASLVETLLEKTSAQSITKDSSHGSLTSALDTEPSGLSFKTVMNKINNKKFFDSYILSHGYVTQTNAEISSDAPTTQVSTTLNATILSHERSDSSLSTQSLVPIEDFKQAKIGINNFTFMVYTNDTKLNESAYVGTGNTQNSFDDDQNEEQTHFIEEMSHMSLGFEDVNESFIYEETTMSELVKLPTTTTDREIYKTNEMLVTTNSTQDLFSGGNGLSHSQSLPVENNESSHNVSVQEKSASKRVIRTAGGLPYWSDEHYKTPSVSAYKIQNFHLHPSPLKDDDVDEQTKVNKNDDKNVKKNQTDTHPKCSTKCGRSSFEPVPRSEAAVSVVLTNHFGPTKEKILPFDLVLLDLVGNYDNTTGMFICTVPGTYVISLNLMSHPGAKVNARIFVNNRPISALWADDVKNLGFYPSSSTQTIVQLGFGDQVYVMLVDGGYGDSWVHANYNAFTLFLLYEQTFTP